MPSETKWPLSTEYFWLKEAQCKTFYLTVLKVPQIFLSGRDSNSHTAMSSCIAPFLALGCNTAVYEQRENKSVYTRLTI